MHIPELVFTDYHDNHVVVMCDVVKRLYQYRQLHPASTEAGGILIGERRGRHIVITDISEPGLGDIRSRNQFTRKGEHHRHKANESFRTSGGYQDYVGEWHTHPEDHPHPSCLDMKSWRTGLSASQPMVMLIIGRLSVWAGQKEGEGDDISKLKVKPAM